MNPTFSTEVTNSVANGVDRVRSAIAQASRRTGMDFGYLYNQAKVESGLRPDAKARTSSASGLFQFIDQSWLAALKRHGAKHGLGWAANCISAGAGGRLCVTDPGMRASIMGLRNVPEASALMAAETASDNRDVIERATGRVANATDLYMGHFLGPQGAADFLGAMAANPGQRADRIAPAAAASNRPIFYTPDGAPRTLAEVYDRFAAKMGDDAASGTAQPVMMADADEGVGEGDGEAGAGLPPLPMTLARALSGNDVSGGLEGVFAQAKPETARLAYLMLASLGA